MCAAVGTHPLPEELRDRAGGWCCTFITVDAVALQSLVVCDPDGLVATLGVVETGRSRCACTAQERRLMVAARSSMRWAYRGDSSHLPAFLSPA